MGIRWVGFFLLLMVCSADLIRVGGKIGQEVRLPRPDAQEQAGMRENQQAERAGGNNMRRLLARQGAIDPERSSTAPDPLNPGGSVALRHRDQLGFKQFFADFGDRIKGMWTSLVDRAKKLVRGYGGGNHTAELLEHKKKLNGTTLAMNVADVGLGILTGMASLLVPALNDEEVDDGVDAVMALKRCFYPPRIKEQYFPDDTMWDLKGEMGSTDADFQLQVDAEDALGQNMAERDEKTMEDNEATEAVLDWADKIDSKLPKLKKTFKTVGGILKKVSQILSSLLKHAMACGYGSLLVGIVMGILIAACPYLLLVLIPIAAIGFSVEVFRQIRNLVRYWNEDWFLFGKSLGLVLGYIASAILVYKAVSKKGQAAKDENDNIFGSNGGTCSIGSGRRLMGFEHDVMNQTKSSRKLLGLSSMIFGPPKLCPIKRGATIKKVLNKNELQGFTRTKRFYGPGGGKILGNKIYQRDDLIKPLMKDSAGRTNIQRMLKGMSPLGPDGKSVNLHHVHQTMKGPVAELSETFHKINHGAIHQSNRIPSKIDRKVFATWRYKYWRERGLQYQAVRAMKKKNVDRHFQLMGDPAGSSLNEGDKCWLEGAACHNCCPLGNTCSKKTLLFGGEGCRTQYCCVENVGADGVCERIVDTTVADMLCREPTEAEVAKYVEECKNSGATIQDLQDTLANSQEFKDCAVCKNSCQTPPVNSESVQSYILSQQKNVGKAATELIDNYKADIADSHPFLASLLETVDDDLGKEIQASVDSQPALAYDASTPQFGYLENDLNEDSLQLWEEEFGGLDEGEIAGIVVGSLVLLLAVAVAIYFFVYKRNQRGEGGSACAKVADCCAGLRNSDQKGSIRLNAVGVDEK